MNPGEQRGSTSGYVASGSPLNYVQCVERQLYAVEPNTSQNDNIVIITSDDIDVQTVVNNPHQEKQKPNDFLELTIVACLFNFLFGMVAMALSFRSKESWKHGERTKAWAYGYASMLISVLAIITTGIIIFVTVWLYVLKCPSS